MFDIRLTAVPSFVARFLPSGVFVPQPTVPTLRLVTRVLGLPQYATVNFYTVAATTPYLSLTRASFIIHDVFFS
jgi:hypothetical protein